MGVVLAAQAGIILGSERAGFEFLSCGLMLGAALACLPGAALMRWLSRTPGTSTQAASGAVLTVGFGGGYLLDRWFAPLPLKVDGFLAGSVVTVGRADVAVAGGLAVVVVIAHRSFCHTIAAVGFDPIGCLASGQRPVVVERVVMVLVCLTIAALVPAVGTIVPIALLAAPAASLWPRSVSVGSLIRRSALLGALISIVGLLLAVRLGLSVGGVIGMLCSGVYLVSRAGFGRDVSRSLRAPERSGALRPLPSPGRTSPSRSCLPPAC